MDLDTGAVPGDEAVPDSRIRQYLEANPVRGRRRVCQSGISDCQEDGGNRGGLLYSDRRSTTGGSGKAPAEGAGREGIGGDVTEQQHESQEGRGREMGGGRTSEHWRRGISVTAADTFPNAKRRRGAEVTNCSVTRQDNITEMERYFAKGLESSAPTVSQGDRMPTVQNISEVQRKCGARGRTELHEQESTMNRNKHLVEEEADPRGRGGVVASLP